MGFKTIFLILIGIVSIGLFAGCGLKEETESTNVFGKNEELSFALKFKTLDLKEENTQKKHQKETKQDKNKKESKKKKNEASKNDSGENKGNNKESQKSTPDVNKASGTYFITAPSLNVRSGDGTNYDVLGSLSANSKIEITGKTSNDWYQFDFKGQKGYISSNYTSTEKVETTDRDTSDKHTSDNNNKTDDKGKSSHKEDGDQNKSNKNVVDKMKNLGDSQQVVLITTKGYNTSTGQVRTFEKESNGKWQQILNATSYIGKNGFTGNKTEGDGMSPTGKYSIGYAFGYKGDPGTKLNFKSSTSNDIWVDDPDSKYYNTWQYKDNEDKDWNSAEEMTHSLYGYGFVINYNTNQTPGKGSAIFMHANDSYTVGCTATNEGDLIKIMNWLDPGKSPVIIQTPESELGNY